MVVTSRWGGGWGVNQMFEGKGRRCLNVDAVEEILRKTDLRFC